MRAFIWVSAGAVRANQKGRDSIHNNGKLNRNNETFYVRFRRDGVAKKTAITYTLNRIYPIWMLFI